MFLEVLQVDVGESFAETLFSLELEDCLIRTLYDPRRVKVVLTYITRRFDEIFKL